MDLCGLQANYPTIGATSNSCRSLKLKRKINVRKQTAESRPENTVAPPVLSASLSVVHTVVLHASDRQDFEVAQIVGLLAWRPSGPLAKLGRK
jgi:hypothetical protein